jgi:hypothetical protein
MAGVPRRSALACERAGACPPPCPITRLSSFNFFFTANGMPLPVIGVSTPQEQWCKGIEPQETEVNEPGRLLAEERIACTSPL